jgi:hypothetical protein
MAAHRAAAYGWPPADRLKEFVLFGRAHRRRIRAVENLLVRASDLIFAGSTTSLFRLSVLTFVSFARALDRSSLILLFLFFSFEI